MQKALERKNLKPVYVGRFDLGVKDVTEQLKEARNAGADVLFIYTIAPQNAVVASGRHKLGWKVPQVGAWALSFPLFIDGAKEAAEGSLMALSFVAEPTNERRATFLASYARKFNAARIPVPMAAAQAYDATYLLAHAVLSLPAGKLDGPHIKQAPGAAQARVLRRRDHLRQAVPRRQGGAVAEHAGGRDGEEWHCDVRPSGRRDAQPCRAAQAGCGCGPHYQGRRIVIVASTASF